MKEEKQNPKNYFDEENGHSNKENINSNIIVSNTLLDSLIKQDNEVSDEPNTLKDFSITKEFTHKSLPMMRKDYQNQQNRLLSFSRNCSRKNSVCSNSSLIISNITSKT